MKKMLLLLLCVVLLVGAALAESTETPASLVIPVAKIDAAPMIPEIYEPWDNAEAAWTHVLLSDGTRAIAVTYRYHDDLAHGFSVLYRYENGPFETISHDETRDGWFQTAQDRWTEALGRVYALWTVEEKALFDQIYAFVPSMGVPEETDLPADAALKRALEALTLENETDYEVGYGYVAGGTEGSGMWQVYFVKGDETVWEVTLDAATGEVLFIEPDEEGNG